MALIADESTPTQRVYGKGFVEGLKAAGVLNIGEVMNAQRLKSIEDGLNGMQRKVYECIPDSGVISLPQVIGELKSAGSSVDHGTVKACLGQLLEKGVIRSVEDKFLRVRHSKPVLVSNMGSAPSGESTPAPPMDRAGPFERLAAVGSSLRNLSSELSSLAKSIDDAAVDAELLIEKAKKENSKFSQLKELLKDI